MATSQKVVRISDGQRQDFAQFPQLAEGAGFLTGLHLAEDGTLYAGLASFQEGTPSGVYMVGPQGGDATLFATADGMVFPNDFAIDVDGKMIVSDTIAGVLWRIDETGRTERWLEDPMLLGDPMICAPDEAGFSVGANGLSFAPDGRLFVAVTDRATVFEVATDGSDATGLIAMTETNCELLEGADGIIATDDGIIVAANRSDQLSFIGYDGAVSSISRSADLDFPASIVDFDGGYLVTNFGLLRAAEGTAKVGLLFVD